MGWFRDVFSPARPRAMEAIEVAAPERTLVDESLEEAQLDEQAAGDGAIAYRFLPRRVHFISEAGWDVRVLDEITGEELWLVPPYRPRRTPRRATPPAHVATPLRYERREGALFVNDVRVCAAAEIQFRDPAVRVRGDAWCVVDRDLRDVVVGRIGHTPRHFTLGFRATHVWVGEQGLACASPFIVAFIPFDVLERDGQIRARPIDVRDKRETAWTAARVSHRSESFSLINTVFGRKNFVWPGAGFAKDEAVEVADFLGEYNAKGNARGIGLPTLLRRHGVALQLDPQGQPSLPAEESIALGDAGAVVSRVPKVHPTIELLRELGLLDAVTDPAVIDRAILEYETVGDTSCADSILTTVYGFGAGQSVGFVSYDHRFLNDTDDPVADFVALCAEPRLEARLVSITKDYSKLELELRTPGKTWEQHTLALDDGEFFDQLGQICNCALTSLESSRRLYAFDTGADYYAFVACSPDKAKALANISARLSIL